MLLWVVGGGGLLGSAVAAAAGNTFVGTPVPWENPPMASSVLRTNLGRFATEAGGEDWAVVWAAGRGHVGSADTQLDAETTLLERFVGEVRRTRPRGPGTFFLASSAGGVYAGASTPPFSEATSPRPISAYGRAKLAQEKIAIDALGGELSLLIGRLSNIYGPGQDLRKPQGLVSHLCVATARRQPLNLFVPIETIRDYLYVDDAADMIARWIRSASTPPAPHAVVRNLASRRPTSLAAIFRMTAQIARRPIRLALGQATAAAEHVRDLRMASLFEVELTATPITPLPVGIKRVYERALFAIRQ